MRNLLSRSLGWHAVPPTWGPALMAGMGPKLIGTDFPGLVPVITVLAIGAGMWMGLLLYRYVEQPLLQRLRRA